MSSSAASSVRSRRDRAFLGDVPEDFLRLSQDPTSAPVQQVNATSEPLPPYPNPPGQYPPVQPVQPAPPPNQYPPAQSVPPPGQYPPFQATGQYPSVPPPGQYPSVPPPGQYPSVPPPGQYPLGQFPPAQPLPPPIVPITYVPATVHSQYRSGVRGRLKITVSEAKLVKNYGLTRMDPYCRVRVGNGVFETATDTSGSKNPRWNKTFTCNLQNGVESLVFEVFDERTFAMDERIAYVHFQLPDHLFLGEETVDTWVPLNGKQGEGEEGTLHIVVNFIPIPSSSSYQLSAYGNQPISVVPTTMPGAQVFYHGGYPPRYNQPQQQPDPEIRRRRSPLQKRREQTEKDMSSLQDMFPSLERDIIQSVLEANNGQMDTTVTNLLQMTEGQ